MNDLFRSQFRLPNELADKLRDAAQGSGRSLNAEVVARLEESFAGRANLPSGLLQSFFELVRVSSTVNAAHDMHTTLLMKTISALEEKFSLLLENADEAKIKAISQRIEANRQAVETLHELCGTAHAEKITLEDLIAAMIDKAIQSPNT